MIRRIAALAFFLALAAPVFADYVPGQIIVKFKRGASVSSLGVSPSSVRSFGLSGTSERARVFSEGVRDYALINLPDGMTVDEALARYRNHPLLDYVGPNPRVKALLTPNDAGFAAQWSLHNTGQTINGTAGVADADIDAPEAWDIETGASSPVIVAILDSGIDYNHPDLNANMWINAAEASGVADFDDDGNGIIDDIYGAKFNRVSGPATGNPMDDYFHGTHVAGIVGAVTNNSSGMAGISWSVKLMALKFLDSSGNGDVARAIEAIQYAVDKGASVVNNSWGTQVDDPALKAAIVAARNAGVTFTAAAGNDVNSSAIYYPAGYPEVIAVSATDNRDRNRPLNYGAHIDLGAPGHNIFSTTLSGSYVAASGTSMATPHVSGVAALLKARQPSLSPAQIHTVIVNSVDVPANWNSNFGAGRLNANNAVRALSDTTPPTISITSPAEGSTVSGQLSVTTTAGDNVGVTRVVFFVQGVAVSTDTTAPFTASFNTTLVPNGNYSITARAYDAAGNQASATVNVTVANGDTTPPTVTLIRPTNGATVGGIVPVDATATDNVGVVAVAFLIDGVVREVDTTAPYGTTFNALLVSEGTHTVTARAADAAGNTSEYSVNVIVRGIAASLGLFEPRFNPARGENLSIPLSLTGPARVSARIYDRFGSEIVSLVDSDLSPGAQITWDGKTSGRDTVASGTYILVIEIDGNRETKKIIVKK